jgi:hypothetical protein
MSKKVEIMKLLNTKSTDLQSNDNMININMKLLKPQRKGSHKNENLANKNDRMKHQHFVT